MVFPEGFFFPTGNIIMFIYGVAHKMRMSKNHGNALIALGIVVCAGFLLSSPAIATPAHGLVSMGSGESFPSSFDDLLTAGNGSGSSSIQVPRDDENTSDASLTQTAAGARVSSGPSSDLNGAAEPQQSLDQGPGSNESSFSLETQERTADGWAGDYQDERLAGLINTASIRLMKLSMEHAHALYLQDTDAAAVAADDLHAFSIRLLGEVESIPVSPEQQPTKDEFIKVLEAYSAASDALLAASDADTGAVSTAFKNLTMASDELEAVTLQAGEIQQPARTATPARAAAPVVQTGDRTGPVQVSPPPEILSLRERYTYDDPSGENMISLLVESTRTTTAFQEAPVNASVDKIEAGDGRIFFLVVVKSTNLGHKGDSDLYSIETPDRNAFTLECQGSTFTPLEVPEYTTFGESFDRKTLERYESLKGSLFFDLPASLNTSEAVLRADLGYAGTPAWNLGGVSGEPGG